MKPSQAYLLHYTVSQPKDRNVNFHCLKNLIKGMYDMNQLQSNGPNPWTHWKATALGPHLYHLVT